MFQFFQRDAFKLISSTHQFRELYHALSAWQLERKYGIMERDRRRLISQLNRRAVVVEPRGVLRVCRDPKDDYVIEMAILGRASHLATEDKDILDDSNIVATLNRVGVSVVRVAEMLALLALSPPQDN